MKESGTMTKKLMATILILTILLASGAYFYSLKAAEKKVSQIDVTGYAVRKEELLAIQIKLEQAVAQLNQTLNQQLEVQKVLTDQITELSKQANLPPPIINKTTVVAAPAPAPKPVPTPVPVTRAS